MTSPADTPDDQLVQQIRRLLADYEDARKALARAGGRLASIGDQLADLRLANPDAYAAAYKEAKR